MSPKNAPSTSRPAGYHSRPRSGSKARVLIVCGSICQSCFVSTPGSSQREPQVTIASHPGGSYLLSASTNTTSWSVRIWYRRAAVFQRLRRILYVGDGLSLFTRSFDGTARREITALNGIAVSGLSVGGDAAVVSLRGPTAGVTFFQVGEWPGIWSSSGVVAINVRTHSTLWRSNVAHVGWVRWTDGNVFLSIRPNLTRGYVRAAQRRGRWLPCYAELRRVANHKLLWKRQIAGCPPDSVSVEKASRGVVRFRFAGERKDNLKFVRPLSELVVDVPLPNPLHANRGDPYVVRSR